MEPTPGQNIQMGMQGKKPEEPKKAGSMQWVWVLIGLLVVGGLVYYFGKQSTPSVVIDDEASSLQDEQGREPGPSLMWEFSPAGGDAMTGAPKTKVMLVANGETRDLGIFTGSCMVVDGSGSWALSEGEITGVICYFAGGGDEIGVFYDSGAYVVKKGVVEEGSAEEPGFRGNYEALFTL